MATSTFISSSLVSSNVYLWDKYGSNAYLNGGIALTRKAAADANGRFCWSSGTLSRFTNTATPKLYDPIYATAAATDQTVVTSVTSVGATGIYAGGSGLLLAPTTRLGCVEMNTAGGISRDGDTLSFDGSSVIPVISSHFVPLVKVSSGEPTPMTYELTSTMYGNMFSPNASAEVESVGISTGYGTLLLNSYTVVPTIRAEVPPGALTIPSESAAAIALAYKQDKLTVVGGGEMLHIDSNSYLHISSTGAIALTSSAGWDHKIPSEMAVRGAINVASADCINHADDLYDIINNSHYATEVWVTENFALKGEGGGGQIEGSYGPATYNSEGMIRPVLGGGLVITDAAHADLSVASATSAVFGGIRLGSNFYTTSRTVEVDHVSVLVSHCLTLSAATTDVLGGITVPTGNGGLVLSSGALSLNVASSYEDYTVAAAGTYGGVKVVRTIAGTTVNNYLYSGYVPSVQAVYDHVSGLLTSYTDTVTLNANFASKAPPSDQNAGIIIPGSGLDPDGYVVNLAAATTTSIGGVIVPNSKGLTVGTGGTLTLSKAPVSSTFGAVSTTLTNSAIGGVVVMMGDLGASAGNWSDIAQDAPVVPNISAMKQYTAANYVSKTDYATTTSAGIVQPSTGLAMTATSKLVLQPATDSVIGGVSVPAYAGLDIGAAGELGLNAEQIDECRITTNVMYDANTRRVKINKILVVDPSGAILAYRDSYLANCTASTDKTIYVSVTKDASRTYTYYATSGSGYQWKSGSTSCYTKERSPLVGSLIYNDNSLTIVAGQITSISGSTSITATKHTISVGSSYYAPTATTTYFPIARVLTDASYNTTIYQIQGGPIISGLETGGLESFTVSPGTGINITGSSATGCTVSLAGEVAGSYNGPFQVSSTGTGANNALTVNLKDGLYTSTISPGTADEQTVYGAGIVSCLDDSYLIRGATFSDVTVPDGGYLYLCGSSGTEAGIGTVTGVVPHTAKFNIGASPEAYATDAGGFATLLAKNSGGKLIQIQYGDITSNHWGDDYKLDYTISRVPITGAPVGYLGYRFIVYNGGKIIGLGANNSTIAWSDIKYPKNADVNSSDSLYYNRSVHTGGYMEVWLNIWSGTCPASSGGGANPTASAWRYVCDSLCYEMDTARTYAKNAYSIQLAYITNNGAPIQIQKGAIDVRGRWA